MDGSVFISYSRRDQTYVRALRAALGDRGVKVWVDWENISGETGFLPKLYRAIEAADTLLFIASPAAMRSEVCRLEVRHALAHGKRVVSLPVLTSRRHYDSDKLRIDSLRLVF